MAHQSPTLEIRCPSRTCGGEVRIRWDGIALCLRCSSELGVWGTPLEVSQDSPESSKWRKPLLVGAVSGLVLVLASLAGFGVREVSNDTRSSVRAPGLATFAGALSSETPPSEFSLPGSYRDPAQHVEAIRSGEHTALNSPLFLAWQQFPPEERFDALDHVIRHQDVAWLSSFLIDIVYFGMSCEFDPYVADMIRAATLASSHQMPDVGIGLMEYIGTVAAVPRVRNEARSNAQDLRARLRRTGR